MFVLFGLFFEISSTSCSFGEVTASATVSTSTFSSFGTEIFFDVVEGVLSPNLIVGGSFCILIGPGVPFPGWPKYDLGLFQSGERFQSSAAFCLPSKVFSYMETW